jgi:hypothetical protein
LYLGLPVQIGTPIPGSRLELALGSASNPSLTFLGDTNTGIFSPAADTIAFSEGGVEALRINSSGTVVLSGGDTTANGTGITFPATQSASSNANTLDDYEEGTFNPTVTVGTSGSITLKTALDTLAYTKIGRIITITGMIGVASVSSPIGGVGISGLPFPIGTLAEDSEGIGIIILFQDAPSYVGSLITAVADQGVTSLTTSQVGSSVGADDQYRFSFSYFTN